jgi:hypothetical protein
MVGCTKDNIIMIKKKDMENLDGQMVADSRGNGSMENKKDMEYIIILEVK